MKAKLLLLTAALAVSAAQGAASPSKSQALFNAYEWLNYLRKSGKTDPLLNLMVDNLKQKTLSVQEEAATIKDINEHIEDMKRLEHDTLNSK